MELGFKVTVDRNFAMYQEIVTLMIPLVSAGTR
jgi:hypothetical protein